MSDAGRAPQAPDLGARNATGRVLMTIEAKAFLYLGPDLYGFAPRGELPSWVPGRPDPNYVGRELEGR